MRPKTSRLRGWFHWWGPGKLDGALLLVATNLPHQRMRLALGSGHALERREIVGIDFGFDLIPDAGAALVERSWLCATGAHEVDFVLRRKGSRSRAARGEKNKA